MFGPENNPANCKWLLPLHASALVKSCVAIKQQEAADLEQPFKYTPRTIPQIHSSLDYSLQPCPDPLLEPTMQVRAACVTFGYLSTNQKPPV